MSARPLPATPSPMSRGSLFQRRVRLRTALLLTAAILSVAIGVGVGIGAGRQPTTLVRGLAGRPRGAITVTLGAGGRTVPRSFLGLSTEYWAMPLYERHLTDLTRILRLLHVGGSGPLLLRIGGDSADHALFEPKVSRLPSGLFDLNPAWFARVSALLHRAHADVLLDLNLASDLTLMAAQWARAAELQLPPSRIVGYEVGNEPDLYNPTYWSELFEPLVRPLGIRPFTHELTPAEYTALYRAYALVLARFAPRMPLAAPVLAYPAQHVFWIRRLLGSRPPGLGLVSSHLYPYSACAAPGSPVYPTIPRLLSEHATHGMAALLRPVIDLVHRDRYPFRLTELNSVTCGGLPGISDRFVTALWAPDALFELLRAGVDGVNVHVRAYAVNPAFALGRRGLVPRPMLYGLILFVRTLGTDPTLVPTYVSAPPTGGLKVWAVRVRGGGLHVLLINKGPRPARVVVRLSAGGPGAVQRLLAASPAARSGETLGGQALGLGGTWRGRLKTEEVSRGTRGYALSVPATSAALLSVAPPRGG